MDLFSVEAMEKAEKALDEFINSSPHRRHPCGWWGVGVSRGEGAYLSSICIGTKRDGSPCALPSTGSSGLCWAHDPANAERRRRGQSRGGRNKPSRELQAIKQRLSDLADGVLDGSVDRANAAVVGQLLNTVIHAVGVELKVREQEEVLTRIEELEALLKDRDQEGERYGA